MDTFMWINRLKLQALRCSHNGTTTIPNSRTTNYLLDILTAKEKNLHRSQLISRETILILNYQSKSSNNDRLIALVFILILNLF